MFDELHKSRTLEVFQRPFYELIVDGIHSHRDYVRVSGSSLLLRGTVADATR